MPHISQRSQIFDACKRRMKSSSMIELHVSVVGVYVGFVLFWFSGHMVIEMLYTFRVGCVFWNHTMQRIHTKQGKSNVGIFCLFVCLLFCPASCLNLHAQNMNGASIFCYHVEFKFLEFFFHLCVYVSLSIELCVVCSQCLY